MNLLEHEVYELLEKNGLKAPAWSFVKRNESPKLSAGKKYVAKIAARDILHKSDCGGILFHITSDTAANAHSDLCKKFASADGVLYVEEVSYNKSCEMIVGAFRDEFFGPLVTIGFGGTGTDFYGTVMKQGKAKLTIPANLDEKKIEELLKELPIVKLATGNVRGFSKSTSTEEILKAVLALKNIILNANPPIPPFSKGGLGGIIEEIEVNPLVCSDGKVLALDGVCRKTEKIIKRQHKPLHKIGNLLKPKSVCIVGASGKNPNNATNVILKNLLAAGVSKNEIFLLHPKEEMIEGIKCYPTLESVLNAHNGKPVDMMVIGVPAKTAAMLVEESLKLNAAHSMQIISAGFGETEGGKGLQKNLEEKLAALDDSPEKRPVINGPNTLGNIADGIRTLFTSPLKNSCTNKGHENVGLICQSGAFLITRVSDLANIINPSVSMSVGNQMDLTVVDCLEYLLDDPKLTTFGLYIEGFKPADGEHLMGLCQKANKLGKYVVIYKAGRTKAGMDAAKGHTAAAAGSYELFSELLTRSGAVLADSFEEFQNLLMLTSMLKNLKRTHPFQIAALSNAGFEKCGIADHLMNGDGLKFKLADYTSETINKIKATFESHNVAGIMDIHDILDLTPMMDDSGYDEIIRATLSDKNVTFGLYSIVPETFMLNIREAGTNRPDDISKPKLLDRLIAISKEINKPFCVSMESGWKYVPFAEECIAHGIPCFRYADEAARAINKLLTAIL